MYQDEVIKAVWKNRDDLASEHNHDLTKMAADLKARHKHAGNNGAFRHAGLDPASRSSVSGGNKMLWSPVTRHLDSGVRQSDES